MSEDISLDWSVPHMALQVNLSPTRLRGSGPREYWELTIIAGPDLNASGVDYDCQDGGWYERTWERYQAIGTWTYHGWVAPLCIAHDITCSWWLLGCLWAAPCGSPQYQDWWSYNEWMQGYTFGSWSYIGGTC